MAAVSSSPVVQAIDQKSIHQICSGQVVLSIATAMKELVENSLDAGATNIDIKLKNHGADVLEVNDNGSGVEPHNFEALTLKHHTSKLKDFSDLTSVETFGFRGEALSSLCALSKLSIVTHHSSQPAATRLEFDHNGRLLSKNPCARDVGTTVSLQNLFSTLPVRHREFLRNIKREFSKLVHVLQGYCLVSTGVRIACSNQVEKGKKTTVVSTNGSEQVKDNITCVFGPKQIQTIMAFEQSLPAEEDCNEFGLNATKIDTQGSLFKVTGYVSKPDHGMGRSSADRQFLYINKRPCELGKVSRVINEVYHMYNRHQYPFVMLDISLARDGVDVNVTPDKRQVFVQEEKVLLATIRTSLKGMYDPSTASFDVNQKPLMQIKLSDSFVSRNVNSVHSPENGDLQRHEDSSTEVKKDVKIFESVSMMKARSDVRVKKGKFPSLSSFKRKFSSLDEDLENRAKEPSSKQVKLTSMFVKEEGGRNYTSTAVVGSEEKRFIVTHSLGKTEDCSEERRGAKTSSLKQDRIAPIVRNRKEVTVSFSMDKLKSKAKTQQREEAKAVEARLFRAKIAPDSNSTAEKELRKNISKGMFQQMEVLGQFNLGFIIAKLDNDLFIVDQHASDEKFNFEDQQRNTTIKSQRLIAPQRLELTAANEAILMDNVEIFQKNGFDFEIDQNAEAMKKIKLVSLPTSKNWTFGVEDIEELIFMLSDSPGVMCRPSRVRKMFASRACRMSIMVGTALNHAQMRKILCHMGEIEHPWNCPHGRPTMRHLVNLNMLPSSDSD
ncbi:mismatch repair endonuclease PMS2-like isoform X2 [Oculina patagonica]